MFLSKIARCLVHRYPKAHASLLFVFSLCLGANSLPELLYAQHTPPEVVADQIRWVRIPSGKFMMGSPVPPSQLAMDFKEYEREGSYFQDEYPQHVVEITKPFFISPTEVTVGQFRLFVEETGYRTEAEVDGFGGWGFDPKEKKCVGRDPRFTWRDAGYLQTDLFPVVNVSWADCQAYCKWLSTKEKRIVRLPTEAEWEYCNRANIYLHYNVGNTSQSVLEGARTRKPTKESIRQAVQNLEIDPDDSTSFPQRVGLYAPNAFGLYDMHGNVWEWTNDWYDADYYKYSPLKDPQGPVQGDVKIRRGGGWNSFPLWARSSFRNWNTAESRCVNLGFRVVAELSSWEIEEYNKQQPIRLNFVGDIMLDNGPGNAIMNGIDPFANVASWLLDSDATIGNLECVLGREGEMILKPYNYLGAKNSDQFLKRYFTALSLANNHAYDFGPEGLMGTVNILKQNGIGSFGAGEDINSARHGLLLNVRGRKVALLGYNHFRMEDYEATETKPGCASLKTEWVIEDIKRVKKDWNAEIVIPFLHWGREMQDAPLDIQRIEAKQWIDAGATAVIGGHPHVVQTVDSYRGAPIIYSLGNFVFDYYPVDPLVWIGWGVRLTIPPSGPVEWETMVVELDPRGIPKPVVPD